LDVDEDGVPYIFDEVANVTHEPCGMEQITLLIDQAGRAGFGPASRRANARGARIQADLARDWAGLNGWTSTRSRFSVKALADGGLARAATTESPSDRIFDHVSYFRDGRCAAAIVTQPYAVDPDTLASWLSVHRLRLWAPPNPWASFHYPGRTLFLVLTCETVRAVRWLPEQLAYKHRFPELVAAAGGTPDRARGWQQAEDAVVAARTGTGAERRGQLDG
jgi:hypothetical protein